MFARRRVPSVASIDDLLAWSLALTAGALFCWLWLTLGLTVILNAAASTRWMDASFPRGAVLAVAAIVAIALLAGGILIMQLVLSMTLAGSRAAIRALRTNARAMGMALLRMLTLTVVTLALLIGTVLFVTGYVLALRAGLMLSVHTAELVETLLADAPSTLGALWGWGRAFASMYLAVVLVTALVVVPIRVTARLLHGRHPAADR